MKNTTFKEVFKTITTVLSWTAFCLLLLIGGFLLYYVISTQIYAAKGETFEPPIALYTIISPSMEPKIKVYDVIVNTKVTDPTKLKVGDIITFSSTSSISEGMTVTHRIVEITEKNDELAFRTKGDNNTTADSGLVPASTVFGKTIMKIPQLGRVQFFLGTKGGWFIAILVPALGIIIYDILKLLKLVGIKKRIQSVEQKPQEDLKRKTEEEKRKKDLLKKLNIMEEKVNDYVEEETNSDPPPDPTPIEEDVTSNINEIDKELEEALEKVKQLNKELKIRTKKR